MSWVYVSLLAMVTASIPPITTRWATNNKVTPLRLNTLYFVGSFFLYLVTILVIDKSTLVPLIHSVPFLLWGLLFAFCSFLGNIALVNGYANSPNPGYVSTIFRFNIFVILGLSWVFLHEPISFWKTIGLAIAVIGLITLALTEKEKNKKAKSYWFLNAILAALSLGAMNVVGKYMTDHGFSVPQILLILFFWGSLGFLVLSWLRKSTLGLKTESKIGLAAVASYILIAFFANWTSFKANALAVNTGYAQAIVGSSAILT